MVRKDEKVQANNNSEVNRGLSLRKAAVRISLMLDADNVMTQGNGAQSTWDFRDSLSKDVTLEVRGDKREGTGHAKTWRNSLIGSESESNSVVSDFLGLHGLYSLWNSPGQNTGVGSLSLLQGIFPTHGLNLPGAGERHSTRDKGHEEGGSAYAKVGSSLRSAPGYSRTSTPKKPESTYFIALCSHL